MSEIFKDIKGYEGLYQASNLGNIKSLTKKATNGRVVKGCILKPSISKGGYKRVTLCIGYKRYYKSVHQLVAIAFLNHIPNGNKLVVNHIDFNKVNNKIENLEIVTNRTNSNRKHIESTSKYTGVSWHKSTNKWHSQITINGRTKSLGLFDCELKAHYKYEEILKSIV